MATGPRIARFQAPKAGEAGSTQQNKALLSQLKQDIADFRHTRWPPDGLHPNLSQIRDLPIYCGTADDVARYHQDWLPYIQRAHAFYPDAHIGPDGLPLPSTLGLPLFVDHVQRLHLTRTHAKESKSFGAVGTLIDRCGAYSDAQQQAMHDFLAEHPDGQLVAHRAFIDLRAYVFRLHPVTGDALLPERVRFYRTGLILTTLPHFEIVDSRQKPRKQRSDAYQNALGENSTWTIFGREGCVFEDDSLPADPDAAHSTL